MKYYDYTSNFEINPELIEKYIVERYGKDEVYKVCFDESQAEEYFKATEEDKLFELGLSMYYIGEDGYFYQFKPDGSIDKYKKCSDRIIKQLRESRLKIVSKINKDKAHRQKLIQLYDKEITLISKSLSGYDKYIYINNNKSYLIPFRFKQAKNKNAPLLIYFHGAGCLGYDCFKQLVEFKGNLIGKKIPDCNILIPQASYGANFLYSNIKEYVNNCVELTKVLLNNSSIDKNRVYCFGTSFGGCCVWYSICMYPKLFAAAMPVMGTMLRYKEFLPVLKEHDTISIWIAHSSNDNNVNIAADDYLYNLLKDINPNLKYTRWDKYGHNMAKHFYRKEPFIDWMFSKSLDKR